MSHFGEDDTSLERRDNFPLVGASGKCMVTFLVEFTAVTLVYSIIALVLAFSFASVVAVIGKFGQQNVDISR